MKFKLLSAHSNGLNGPQTHGQTAFLCCPAPACLPLLSAPPVRSADGRREASSVGRHWAVPVWPGFQAPPPIGTDQSVGRRPDQDSRLQNILVTLHRSGSSKFSGA